MKGPESRLFGVALDLSDDPLSLEMKRAWMLRSAGSSSGEATDPYDALLEQCPDLPVELGLDPAGKFPVPSWLWARPHPADFPRIEAAEFARYYDSGQLELLLTKLQAFVERRIFPVRPVMLGVDHSASAAVVSALSRRYGAEDLSVIALDQHFDAIPLAARVGQLGSGELLARTVGGGRLSCGNFWAHLLRERVLLPENLSLIGVADYPARAGADKLNSEYRRSYREFEKAGVRFFPLADFAARGKNGLVEFIAGALKASHLYLSLDLDVASFKGAMAARYMDWPGLTARQVLLVASEIRRALNDKGISLVGLDIMEFNQHFLGLESAGGSEDRTLELAAGFLRTLLAPARNTLARTN